MPGSVVNYGLPVSLSHVVFTGVDPDCVAHDAVEYGIDDGVAPEFREESFEHFVGFVDEPFVDCKQVVGGVLYTSLGTFPRLSAEAATCFRQIGLADVCRAVACAARRFANALDRWDCLIRRLPETHR